MSPGFFGRPGFAHSPVYVEHPTQDRTESEMLAIGNEAFDEIVGQLLK